jgi:hypothetical protein
MWGCAVGLCGLLQLEDVWVREQPLREAAASASGVAVGIKKEHKFQ